MTHANKFHFFQTLLPKLGEKGTEVIANYMDSSIQNNNEELYKKLATKEDMNRLELKIVETKTDMVKWIFSIFVVLMVAIIGLYIKK